MAGVPVEVEGIVPVRGAVVTRIVTVPGVGAGAHASGDVVGEPFPIPDLVRVAGGGGVIETVVLIESTTNSVGTELWLFDDTISSAADDAAHSISDLDATRAVGVIPITSYTASALNSEGTARGVGLAFNCKAGSRRLVGLLVTRGAPTYAAGGITLKVSVILE